KAAVQKRMDDYLTVVRASRYDSLANFWSKDVRVFETGMEIHNRAEWEALVAEVTKTMKTDSITLTTDEIFAHDGGAVAYQHGHYMEALHYIDGKKPPEIVHGNFVARWVKESDGVWRMARFISTPQPAPASPMPAAKK